MEKDCLSKTNTPELNTYSTSELKLAGLLLAEIPDSSFVVYPQSNFSKKLIQITYPKIHEEEAQRLVTEFIERRAYVNLYRFNKALNPLRDALKSGKVKNGE